jgi:hypothetical protein
MGKSARGHAAKRKRAWMAMDFDLAIPLSLAISGTAALSARIARFCCEKSIPLRDCAVSDADSARSACYHCVSFIILWGAC